MIKFPFTTLLLFLTGYSIAQPLVIQTKTEEVTAIKISCVRFFDDNTLAIGGIDNKIHLFSLKTLDFIKNYSGMQGNTDALAVSPKRKHVVATSRDNEIACWDAKSGKLLHQMGEYDEIYKQFNKHIIFDAKEKTFAATSRNCDFPIWTIKDGGNQKTVPTHDGECLYVFAYDKDGTTVYAGGNKTVWSYNLEDGSFINTQNTEEISVIQDLVYHPKTESIAVCGRKGLLLLDKNLKIKHKLEGHSDWINDICFSADGSELYSCSGSMFGKDNTIRVWNVAAAKLTHTLKGKDADINTIDLSPKNKLLVSCSADGIIQIWNTETKKLIASIQFFKYLSKQYTLVHTGSGKLTASDVLLDGLIIGQNGLKLLSSDISKLNDKKAVISAIKKRAG